MQLVQLVCALVHQPKILIFDEPLNGLDLENVGLFKRLCEKLKKEGRIILISSHQYNNIEDLVDDVVYLYRGDTCFKGNLKNLKKKYPQRILILDEDIIDEKDSGVISVEKLGHLYHVKLENEHVASQYVRKLMREKISCFSLEMVSLQMMIREALHERTR